jgi:hypothetical protein
MKLDPFSIATGEGPSIWAPSRRNKHASVRSAHRQQTRIVSCSSLADRPVVDHTYTDHLHDPLCPEVSSGHGPKKAPRGGVSVGKIKMQHPCIIFVRTRAHVNSPSITAFPEKLHIMLSAMVKEAPEIVSWRPHGRNFCVHQKKEFVEGIMPK